MRHLQTPIDEATRLALRVGEEVMLSGIIYTARDQAHKRLVESLNKQEPLPFQFAGQVVYYTGPTPAKLGHPIGSCGPTSSYRMDPYSIILMNAGLKIMIGKGNRSEEFRRSLIQTKSVYLVAVGGIGALLSKTVKTAKLIAYPDLQSEAVVEFEVENFPVIVATDSVGNDLFDRSN